MGVGSSVLILVLGLLWVGDSVAQKPVARFFYDEKGNVSRQERDTNNDGKMDRWTRFNSDGEIKRVEQDENFDGKPDISLYYERGKLKRQEVSTHHDGKIDVWYHYSTVGEVGTKRAGYQP